jgi:hypothetical protein
VIEEFRFDGLAVFDDLPVFAFAFSDPDDLVEGDTPQDVEAWAWRVGVAEYDDSDAEEIFALFLEAVDTARVRALLLGAWYGDVSGEGVDKFQRALLDAADRFPALEALFISDVPQELAEISWIEQQDPADLLAAFPSLRVLGMRGRLDGGIGPFVHARLEELVLQSGGLSPEAVRAVSGGDLPALAGLDLYLGVREYGGGVAVEDLESILSGVAFPKLRHLGLRDAENADELAVALAHAPVVARLESLDLSLGTLSDVGAAALLAGQPLTHLKRLDLHHHFLSDAMIERLWRALPDVEVDVSEQMVLREWNGQPTRYVAVAE